MKGTVIVAPLHWGLGHATRCIPIIKLLIENKYTPVIASDGAALELLLKEFPELDFLALPSYNIEYAKNLRWSLIFQVPKILKAAREERRVIAAYIQKNRIVGIISDNRFGVRSTEVPSVYLTHQIHVLSGIFTGITSKIHQHLIKKFDECWVPDSSEGFTFSGKLSKTGQRGINAKRIGILSRFQKEVKPIDIDVLLVLSGPEPHRTALELKLIHEFETYPGKIVLVQGVLSKKQTIFRKGNIQIYNYMLSKELQDTMNGTALIICRSGYSSILDLAKLNKKAFFIPTPDQSEQEYLARYLELEKWAPYSEQKDFNAEMILNIKEYTGFKGNYKALEASLFDLFEGKREG